MTTVTVTYELHGFMTVTKPTRDECDEAIAEFISVANDHDDVQIQVRGQEEVQQEPCFE